MTGPGFSDVLTQFSAELDAAVVRARRVSAEARETSAKFRRETRQMADKVRGGGVRVTPGELTDDRLRRAASGFRADHGLPVDKLPEGAELLRPAAPQRPEQQVTSANQPFGAPATPGAPRTTPPSRRVPPPSDDDEDFSQARIMR
ncbi:MAG TPA: hypothetical protein VG756_28450 [Pseudonocardiaceae bacterium]|jgi:hypothetical protein|nr:hypothetical protein [Pseudonocardiaceae bacterium]